VKLPGEQPWILAGAVLGAKEVNKLLTKKNDYC